ncbi:MAG: polysaccharide deacetylase family protein [bacterium]
MKRREFVSAIGIAALAGMSAPLFSGNSEKLHIVSLSFDDGFKKSFLRTAEIYESFGLSACFNVIASAHIPGNRVRDDYMKQELFGDFALWNELQDRGHEIMPHGYQHAHLANLPLDKAKNLILRSLDLFSKELRGFEPMKCVFNFPYNQSSPELEEWLPSVVMAFRAHGKNGILNAVPGPSTVKISTGGWGPENAEKHVDETLEKLLARPSGWMVYNLHGLDEEGWGPIGSEYLERLLARLRMIDSVRVVPTARALMQARAGSLSAT